MYTYIYTYIYTIYTYPCIRAAQRLSKTEQLCFLIIHGSGKPWETYIPKKNHQVWIKTYQNFIKEPGYFRILMSFKFHHCVTDNQ